MRSHIKFLEKKLQDQQKELAELRKFRRNFSGSVTVVASDDAISWS
jgi:hypothetical protein